jgi:diadenosine tetraphosphate (Ap4A) HIT family hydrolase
MTDQWVSQEEWAHMLKGDDCPMCDFIKTISDEDEYGFTVAELERSVLRLGRNQWVRGYCVLIARKHYTEPFQMRPQERQLFFEDMARAGEAVQKVFAPDKLNYELLGNAVPHMHVHLTPRYLDDPAPHRRIRPNEEVEHLSEHEYRQLVGDLREALGFIRERVDDPILKPFLDNQGRVTRWPLKRKAEDQMAIRIYMASKFEPNRTYTEREVNDILKQWHTFEDWALLRRELFMYGFFKRLKNGSEYWLTTDEDDLHETVRAHKEQYP